MPESRAAFFDGIIAKGSGEITRKKRERRDSRQRRVALGSNNSCQGPFHRIYSLAPCTTIFLGVDKNLEGVQPLRPLHRVIIYPFRIPFPFRCQAQLPTHCFESEAYVGKCRIAAQWNMSRRRQSACMKHLHDPKWDNCDMPKPTT